MLRLFHTSDTHLGHQQYPRIGPDGLNQRETDLYAAWHRVVDLAVAERPDLFVHAGDLFDGVRPGNRALAHALEGLVKLSRARIPVVLIAGNHEHPKLRETGSPFRLFEHLEGVHVAYKGHAETFEFTTEAGTARIHAVPQCADAQALAGEVAALPTGPRTAQGTPAIPQIPAAGTVGAGIQGVTGIPSPGLDILVVHGAVTGLAAFAHAEFNELAIDPSWFKPFHYVALGHFHGTKQVAPNAWYCGAPERVSMAESGEEKGFLDVTVTPTGAAATFRPLPARRYVDLPALDASGLDAAALRSAALDSLARVPEGAVARLRLHSIDPALRGVLDLRALQKACPQAMHLDLRPEWADGARGVPGSGELGSLAEEFDAFAARQALEGVDRKQVLERARAVLEATP